MVYYLIFLLRLSPQALICLSVSSAFSVILGCYFAAADGETHNPSLFNVAMVSYVAPPLSNI